MNGFLTEPIVLSGEQSKAFFDSLYRPNKEYLNRRDKIFAKMDEEIIIQRNGMNMEVEILDLDLSFIDEMTNTNKGRLTSNIEISGKYSYEVDNISVTRKNFIGIDRERLTTVNNIVLNSYNSFNRIVRHKYEYNEFSGDKLEAYVKDKNRRSMMETCKAEQITVAA